MNKENISNSKPILVLLPQTEWQETTEKIDQMLQLVRIKQEEIAKAQTQERIPWVQFRKDKVLRERYGLTYTAVRKLAGKNLLRSYNDHEHVRYKWTTHEDIMNYFNSIKNNGIKRNEQPTYPA
jgi:hypothetical protein